MATARNGERWSFIQSLTNSPKMLLIGALVNYTVLTGAYMLIEKKGPIASMWWIVVTGFTVGYGDMYPATTAGRGIALLVMVSSWLILSILLVHILGRFIWNEHEYTDAEQKENKTTLGRAVQLLRCILRNQRKIMASQQHIAADLKAIKQQLGIEPAGQPGTTD